MCMVKETNKETAEGITVSHDVLGIQQGVALHNSITDPDKEKDSKQDQISTGSKHNTEALPERHVVQRATCKSAPQDSVVQTHIFFHSEEANITSNQSNDGHDNACDKVAIGCAFVVSGRDRLWAV